MKVIADLNYFADPLNPNYWLEATFNINFWKDCSFVIFPTLGVVDRTDVSYTASNPAETVSFTPAVPDDPHCQIDYEIYVSDNITTVNANYTAATRFGSDPATSAVHADGVSRTESFLIQNMSVPHAPSTPHVINIFTTTTVLANLDDFVKWFGSDYYLYTVSLRTKVAVDEPVPALGSAPFQDTQFSLKLESLCNNVQIVPVPITACEYVIWEPAVNCSLPQFKLLFPWVDPVIVLDPINEATIHGICGNFQYFLMKNTLPATPLDSFIVFNSTAMKYSVHTYDVTKSVTSYATELDMSSKVYNLALYARLSDEFA
jgi:hypothetical protein